MKAQLLVLAYLGVCGALFPLSTRKPPSARQETPVPFTNTGCRTFQPLVQHEEPVDAITSHIINPDTSDTGRLSELRGGSLGHLCQFQLMSIQPSVDFQVFVSGAAPELGQWQPSKMMLLRREGSFWVGTAILKGHGTNVPFKYVLKWPDGRLLWENAERNVWLSPDDSPVVVQSSDFNVKKGTLTSYDKAAEDLWIGDAVPSPAWEQAQTQHEVPQFNLEKKASPQQQTPKRVVKGRGTHAILGASHQSHERQRKPIRFQLPGFSLTCPDPMFFPRHINGMTASLREFRCGYPGSLWYAFKTMAMVPIHVVIFVTKVLVHLFMAIIKVPIYTVMTILKVPAYLFAAAGMLVRNLAYGVTLPRHLVYLGTVHVFTATNLLIRSLVEPIKLSPRLIYSGTAQMCAAIGILVRTFVDVIQLPTQLLYWNIAHMCAATGTLVRILVDVIMLPPQLLYKGTAHICAAAKTLARSLVGVIKLPHQLLNRGAAHMCASTGILIRSVEGAIKLPPQLIYSCIAHTCAAGNTLVRSFADTITLPLRLVNKATAETCNFSVDCVKDVATALVLSLDIIGKSFLTTVNKALCPMNFVGSLVTNPGALSMHGPLLSLVCVAGLAQVMMLQLQPARILQQLADIFLKQLALHGLLAEAEEQVPDCSYMFFRYGTLNPGKAAKSVSKANVSGLSIAPARWSPLSTSQVLMRLFINIGQEGEVAQKKPKGRGLNHFLDALAAQLTSRKTSAAKPSLRDLKLPDLNTAALKRLFSRDGKQVLAEASKGTGISFLHSLAVGLVSRKARAAVASQRAPKLPHLDTAALMRIVARHFKSAEAVKTKRKLNPLAGAATAGHVIVRTAGNIRSSVVRALSQHRTSTAPQELAKVMLGKGMVSGAPAATIVAKESVSSNMLTVSTSPMVSSLKSKPTPMSELWGSTVAASGLYSGAAAKPALGPSGEPALPEQRPIDLMPKQPAKPPTVAPSTGLRSKLGRFFLGENWSQAVEGAPENAKMRFARKIFGKQVEVEAADKTIQSVASEIVGSSESLITRTIDRSIAPSGSSFWGEKKGLAQVFLKSRAGASTSAEALTEVEKKRAFSRLGKIVKKRNESGRVVRTLLSSVADSSIDVGGGKAGRLRRWVANTAEQVAHKKGVREALKRSIMLVRRFVLKS